MNCPHSTVNPHFTCPHEVLFPGQELDLGEEKTPVAEPYTQQNQVPQSQVSYHLPFSIFIFVLLNSMGT
jgi:hypothetical protein